MSKKIKNDKYYTPKWLAEYTYKKTKEICGDFNEIIEPSAGNGVFLNEFKEKTIAFDLYPEDDRIIELDYLENDLEYKKRRAVIGNPPFGNAGNLAIEFILNSLKHSDYVAFILPAGFYKSDRVKGLVYTEYLGDVDFSDRKVKVCLNIYSRGKYFNKEKYNDKSGNIDYLSDVEIKRRGRGVKSQEKLLLKDFDFAICSFGGSTGKEIKYDDQLCKYLLLKSNNKEKINTIRDIIKNTDFKNNIKHFPFSTTLSISEGRLKTYLNKKLSEYYETNKTTK